MQKAIAAFSEKFAIPKMVMNGLQLALEELFNNTVLYGYRNGARHSITIVLRMNSGILEGAFSDDGKPFDPTQYPEPELDKELENREIGGLGIHLARRFFDEWTYSRVNEKNILKFKKQIK